MRKKITIEEYLNSFPVGYRFRPTDEELLIHYLKNKVLSKTLHPNRISEVNLYNYTPEQLFDKYKVSGEKAMYFFTYHTHVHGNRPNRIVANGNGRWKATGVDTEIGSTENPIGRKKVLVYHHRDGKKTGWIMHEYKLDQRTLPITANTKVINDLVLCMVYNRFEKNKNINKIDSSACSTKTSAFHDPIEKADECNVSTETDNNLEPHANKCNCFTSLCFLFEKLVVGVEAIAVSFNNKRSDQDEDAFTPVLIKYP